MIHEYVHLHTSDFFLLVLSAVTSPVNTSESFLLAAITPTCYQTASTVTMLLIMSCSFPFLHCTFSFPTSEFIFVSSEIINTVSHKDDYLFVEKLKVNITFCASLLKRIISSFISSSKICSPLRCF